MTAHHVEDGNPFGDGDDQSIPASAASMIASAANGGGTKISEAFAPVFVDRLVDGVEDREAVDLRAPLAGRDAADDTGSSDRIHPA